MSSANSKGKNPRRVVAQHESQLRKAQRDLWWAIPITVIPLALLIASFLLGWRWWWKVILAFVFLNGCLSLYEIRFDYWRHRRKRDAVLAESEKSAES